MGIDDVYCLSVNDAFVMRQWGLHQGLEEEKEDSSNPLNPGNFKRVKLIPDGACLFTRGMGMSCTWSTERGFGERSWRYAMIINDMKVEKLFVEVSRLFHVAFQRDNALTDTAPPGMCFHSPDTHRTPPPTPEARPWRST
jgi:peroxiredoxin